MCIIPKSHVLNGTLDMAETTSPSKEFFQTCSSSLHVRSKLMHWKQWRRKWKAIYWIRLLFGRIVEPSQPNLSKIEDWISSRLHILAKENQTPEKERAKTLTNGSGHTAPVGKSQEQLFLNADWCEQMMGIPVGWTQIETE